MKLKYISWIYFLALIVLSIGVGFFFEDPFSRSNPDYVLSAPSSLYWFGTDSLGRDLLIRLLYGARTTLLISGISAAGIIIVGLLVGTTMVYLPNRINQVVLRIFDIFEGIPTILAVSAGALLLETKTPQLEFLGVYKTVLVIIVSMILTQWMQPARLLRARLKVVSEEEFIKASISLGATKPWIIRKHLWPAIHSLIWAIFLLQLPQTIFLESFLSFVGLGIEMPLTSWGVLIHEGWKTLSYAPHLIMIPATALLLTTLSITYLRDTY